MNCIRFLIATLAGLGIFATAVEAQGNSFCEAMSNKFRYEFGCCGSNPDPACTGLRQAAVQSGCGIEALCEPCALIGYQAPPAGCTCTPDFSDVNISPTGTPYSCLLPENGQLMCCVDGDAVISCQTTFGGATFAAACYAATPAASVLGVRPRRFLRLDIIKAR